MDFDGQLLTIADYERAARAMTSPAMFDYLYGTIGDPHWSTYASNRAGFEALKLRPRVLVDVGARSLAATLLGLDIALPVVVGPTASLGMHDPLAEIPTVKACGAAGTIVVLSGASTCNADEAAAAATGPWFQQVWLLDDRALVEWQVRRAAELGASAIVLTVSNTGETLHTLPLRFPRSDEDEQMTNFRGYGGAIPKADGFLDLMSRTSTWKDVEWLASLSELPLVVKGIQTGEDAALAVEHGVDAIVVSNHGGRFLQGSRGTMEALPEIVDAVGGRLEVCVDGGVRQGQDVLKALALGARAVWIGRAARWGTTVNGETGVRGVLDILHRELDGTMGLCGVADVTSVPPSLVTRDAIPTREA